MGEYEIETLVQMFLYYEQRGMGGNLNVLTWLLGREPTTLSTFIERTICSLN